MLSMGKLIRDLMPRVLIGIGCVDLIFLTSTKVLKENRLFATNQIVCTNSLGTENCSYQGVMETLLKPKFPYSSLGPALQA